MKVCYKCEISKPDDKFKYSNLLNGRVNVCRDCNNKQAYSLCKIKKKHVADYLMAHPCVDCGESNIVVLEFDHVRQKEIEISRLYLYSIDKINKEIEKCEVRCISCHRLKTLRNSNGKITQGKIHKAAYLKDKKCIDCGESDIRLLDFDHQKDKIASLSWFTKRKSIKYSTFAKEADKCEIRCCRCHRIKTANDFSWFRTKYSGSEDFVLNHEKTYTTKPEPIEKKCNKCGAVKHITFFVSRKKFGRRRGICKECYSIYQNTKRIEYKNRKTGLAIHA